MKEKWFDLSFKTPLFPTGKEGYQYYVTTSFLGLYSFQSPGTPRLEILSLLHPVFQSGLFVTLVVSLLFARAMVFDSTFQWRCPSIEKKAKLEGD